MPDRQSRRPVSGRSSERVRFLVGFAGFFALLWLLWETWVVTPLKLFVVLLHEISHGMAAVATGGSIERIVITADQGGACYCGGGDAFLTLSAGYLGSLLWGVVLVLLASRLGRRSGWFTAVIGIGVGVVSVLYVRNGFGLAFGLAAAGALVAAARFLSSAANTRILWVLGLTSCLYAVLDIKSDIIDRPELPSDAAMLAEMTGVPALLWGVLWIGAALVICWTLLRRLLR